MIEIENLRFSFGDDPVFDGLSLRLPGGVCCIEGPSGVGKTTLLRLIAGLLVPDAGTITGAPARVAFLFQEDRLLPWLDARGNVAAVLPKERAEEAERWLEAVELKSEARVLPEHLSGGQRRRVALARALAFGGELLILDEPLQGMDPGLAGRMAALVKSRGADILATSHSTYETGLWGGAQIRLE